MAEITRDLRGLAKPDAYRELHAEIASVLNSLRDEVTAMATMSCLIHHAFGHLWTGFYRVVEPAGQGAGAAGLLRVGPYQGTLGCLEIAFGSGVCGAAAARQETVLVEDVESFPGHIACDSRARSEIVVPVFGPGGQLVAVLDVDSEQAGTFDAVDQAGLERIVQWFRG